MNNEEARFLLQGYRPDGRDAQDPQFEEALSQVKRDPELEQWWCQQQAFDTVVSQKLHSVPVPANLKAEILAGRKTLRPSAWWTRPSVISMMAACLVVLLGLAAFFMSSMGRPAFVDYRADMVSFVTDVEQGRESLELKSHDVAEIKSWIEENSIHENVELPSRLTADSGLGCRIVDWKGQSVVLACFRLEEGQVAHVLVINRKDIRGGPEVGTRYVAANADKNTVAWSSPTQTYLLVSSAPAEALERLL